MIFFTSDTHFSHGNIIKYCKRPFHCAGEMDGKLISNWNQKVGIDDIVYHLGDFGFGDINHLRSIRERLNGQIFLILGNHDRRDIVRNVGFSAIWPIREIKIENQLIVCHHYSLRVWNKSHRGSWHLYGHSHNTLPELENSLSFDIGVDANNFIPLSLTEIETRMRKKKFIPIDHHGKNEDNG